MKLPNLDLDKLCDFEWLFMDYCKNGNLEAIKKIYLNIIPSRLIHTYGLLIACDYNNLNIIQFLVTIKHNPDIYYDDCYFIYACKQNRLEIAKWIYLQHEPKIETINSIFHYACKNNKSEIIKWLLSLKEKLRIPIKKFKINEEDKCAICFNDNYNFISSCKHTFCVECFMMWYIVHNKKECSYCQQKIEIEKCCILEN